MFDWNPHIEFRPPLGGGWTLLWVAAAMLVIVGSCFMPQAPVGRQRWLLLFRLGAVGLLAWVLAGPSIQKQVDAIDRSIPVLLLVDTSASMAHRDVENPDAAGRAASNRISRWDAVKRNWLSASIFDALRQAGGAVRLYGFDRRLRAMDVNEAQRLEAPDGDRTELLDAIEQVAEHALSPQAVNAQHGPAGLIVLVSDGHDSRQGADADRLARLGRARWPVFTVPVGAGRSVPDVAVAAWAQTDFLLEHQAAWIDVAVTQTGFDDRRVKIELFDQQQPVTTQEVDFDNRPEVRTRFRVVPPLRPGHFESVGAYRVVVGLVPQADPGEPSGSNEAEAFIDNNSRWVFFQVARQRIQVALFEASPYWDTTFLARLLQNDPQVDLTAVYRLGPDRSLTTGQGVLVDGLKRPASNGLWKPTQQELDRFDVVILGKGAELFFGGDRARLLVDYVIQRGGSLVLARGKAFGSDTVQGRQAGQTIGAIEPVGWGLKTLAGLRLQLADAGRTNPLVRFDHLGQTDAVLTHLPDMLAATWIEREKSASVVLLRQVAQGSQADPTTGHGPETHAMAAVAYQNAGHGRVFAVLGDGLWRWSFLPGSLAKYDSVYDLFWTRAIRWLALEGPFLPGQSVAMTQSKMVTEPGQPVTVTITERDGTDQPLHTHLKVTAPDGTARRVVPVRVPDGLPRYVATVTPTQSGVYQLDLETTDGVGVAGVQARRLAVYDPSVERLDVGARPDLLAAVSQATGGQCLLGDAPDRLVDRVRSMSLARQSDPYWQDVFAKPLVLGSIVCLLGMEWFLRRRAGLL